MKYKDTFTITYWLLYYQCLGHLQVNWPTTFSGLSLSRPRSPHKTCEPSYSQDSHPIHSTLSPTMWHTRQIWLSSPEPSPLLPGTGGRSGCGETYWRGTSIYDAGLGSWWLLGCCRVGVWRSCYSIFRNIVHWCQRLLHVGKEYTVSSFYCT